MDGNTVQLHPMNSDNMYVYTVSDHSLYETDYSPMDNAFGSQFVPIEEAVGVENRNMVIMCNLMLMNMVSCTLTIGHWAHYPMYT